MPLPTSFPNLKRFRDSTGGGGFRDSSGGGGMNLAAAQFPVYSTPNSNFYMEVTILDVRVLYIYFVNMVFHPLLINKTNLR